MFEFGTITSQEDLFVSFIQSEIIFIPTSLKGTVATRQVFPRKQATICCEVIRARTILIGFG